MSSRAQFIRGIRTMLAEYDGYLTERQEAERAYWLARLREECAYVIAAGCIA